MVVSLPLTDLRPHARNALRKRQPTLTHELTTTYKPLPKRQRSPQNDNYAQEHPKPGRTRFEKRLVRSTGVKYRIEDQAVEREGQDKGRAGFAIIRAGCNESLATLTSWQ